MPYTILTSSSPEPLFTSDSIGECCLYLDMIADTWGDVPAAVYDADGNVRYEILKGDRNDTTHALS